VLLTHAKRDFRFVSYTALQCPRSKDLGYRCSGRVAGPNLFGPGRISASAGQEQCAPDLVTNQMK
jgi:hypothetical protein